MFFYWYMASKKHAKMTHDKLPYWSIYNQLPIQWFENRFEMRQKKYAIFHPKHSLDSNFLLEMCPDKAKDIITNLFSDTRNTTNIPIQ